MSRTPIVPGYVLVDRLHRSPLADVWRGSRSADGRPVAVKIPAERATTAESVLLRAARHDNLLGVVDEVVLDDGRACLVTDLAEGGSLADLVAARGRLTAGEVAAVVAPVAGAVAELHAQGIVHGDLSAANVLFSGTARPLLADLGSAEAARALTGVWGTEGFVAPEVLGGGDPTQASDVFGLGALVVHGLTGQGVSPLEQTDRVVRRCTDAGELPTELEAVVRACLAGDCSLRPPAAQVATELAALAQLGPLDIGGREPTRAVTYRVHGASAREGERAPAGGVVGRPDQSARRRGLPRPSRRVVVGAAAAAVVAGVGSGLLAAGGVQVGRVLGIEVRPSAPGTPPSASVAVRTPPGSAPPPTAAAAHDIATVHGAAKARPAALLASLLATRAAALESVDPDGLRTVDLPGSWAHERDLSILGELAARDERQRGLRFAVRDARVVSAASTRTLVEASVSVGAYEYVRGGTARHVAGSAPRIARYTLSWQGERWLVERVDPV